MKSAEEIKRGLEQFRGSRIAYSLTSKVIYTEGILYFQEECSAQWLIELIAGWEHSKEEIKDSWFLAFHLKVENGLTVIYVKNCYGEEIKKIIIFKDDFPLDETSIFMMHGIIFLPSENEAFRSIVSFPTKN